MVVVVQVAGPLVFVVSEHATAGFGQEAAAADVAVGFAVGDVDDDFVNGPAVWGRSVLPHL